MEGTLREIAASENWSRVFVAMAYATISGVRKLLEIFSENDLNIETRWVLGLDDFVTQPGAIDLCAALAASEIRNASFSIQGARFHPKVFVFEAKNRKTVLVGSANLTAFGIRRNGEAGVQLQSISRGESSEIEKFVARLWKMGRVPTKSILNAYKKRYQRRPLPLPQVMPSKKTKTVEVFSTDVAEIDPKLSHTCWIEVGKNTALGRELEFKAEQALFFGVDPQGGEAQNRDFLLSNGTIVSLRLKYQANAMWRLQMNNEIPEVKIGLRPSRAGRLGRSPFVAVFKRLKNPNRFSLTFIKAKGRQFQRLRSRSQSLGTIGSTTMREYGWF
jgi:HKD family nuclease